MSYPTLSFLLNGLFMAGGFLTLYAVYFLVIAVFGFKRRKALPAAAPHTRFALVVAARNEAAVIGQLVESLREQNYPDALYDIIVAPNNCTDDTRAVALAAGAQVFDPVGEVHSKGEVLAQVSAVLLRQKKHHAVCVFDADNLVHPDFLQRMNDAFAAGYHVAQGFRDSKNPADTAVSTCYSVCYWMLNRFYNGGREALGLSGLVNGSGFMVSRKLLKELGGFQTTTMTEDYEFSAQCVLKGHKVHYVHDAIIYDEQPLTFFQSWRQRRRWSTGSVQCMEIYTSDLVKGAFKRRSWVCMDLAITYLTPMVQLVSFLVWLGTAVLGAYGVMEFNLIPLTQIMVGAVTACCVAVGLCTLLAAFVVRLNRRAMRGTGRGIVYFALFLLSWMPIGIISLFRKKKTWDAIGHTRTVRVRDVMRAD
ncbi:MAG: glycosyltransferase family 2 protein [Oscillospiraceae bacterium]